MSTDWMKSTQKEEKSPFWSVLFFWTKAVSSVHIILCAKADASVTGTGTRKQRHTKITSAKATACFLIPVLMGLPKLPALFHPQKYKKY